VRCALVVLAACHAPAQPNIEHHAHTTTDELFVLDAPLFSTDATEHVMWTLERHGHYATLTLGDDPIYRGMFEEDAGAIHVEATGATGPLTLACKRAATLVHAAGAQPHERGDHPVCSTPRTWQPPDLLTVTALACTVHRESLITQVVMAPPPGLQAVVDDCCDDQDRCERRWELRARTTAR
jgi:hypothetical protein